MMTSETYQFRGVVQGGIRRYNKPNLHAQHLASLEGKQFIEIIQEATESKTTEQRGYFHAVCRWLTKETEMFGGWSEDEVKMYFKNKFLSVKAVLPDETEVSYILSVADLNKKKMSEFIGQMIYFLNEQGVTIPEPDDFYIKKYSIRIRNEEK